MADKALLFIWLFLSGFVWQLCQCRCPDICDCLGAIINCAQKNDLTQVPSDLPHWVEKLDLSKNEGLKLTKDSFRKLPKLAILDLSKNKGLKITKDAFKNLPKLSILDLSKNKGLKLTEGAFNSLPKLSTLYLRELGLETLPALGSLPGLETLYLSGNRFKTTDAMTLTGMPQLRDLDLSRNRLVNVSPRPFANVTLFKLNLSRNKIARLDSQSFKMLGSLAELKMSQNMLTVSAFNRSAPVFSNLTNLASLDLNGNKIHSLSGLMFQQLKRLKTLKLRRNQITSFSDGALYGLDSLLNLQLDYNNITTVRKGWLFGLKSLEKLTVSHNQIDSIGPDAWKPTAKLKILDLSYNRLVSLRAMSGGTFRSLSKLTKLTLSNNYLAHIARDTFAVTSSLQSLDLSHNQLRWSIEDNSGAFSTLSTLQELSLAYNGIETVHVETFAPLESLASLDLLGNQLRMLPLNPFTGLKHLSTIHLNTSNLVCDCDLSWFPGWLSEVNFNSSTTLKAFCSYPPSLQNQSVANIPSGDFSCESSPRPIISQYPKDFIALRGENVTLACVAQASTEGDQPKFFWRKNNELLVNFDVETRVSVIGGDGKGGAIHNVTSLFHLRNVTDEDDGNYQCVVRNHFGASYAPRASLKVHIFPYFTKKPASVVVQVGGVAKLECAVAGSPAPEMLLSKYGDDDFPAARERRLHALHDENEYFIKPVQPHDQGLYICKASNEVGTATANATITVRQSPKFAKPLQDRVARLGDNAVLECQGTGQPPPKLSWSKNGVPLQEGDHYVLVQESQYLLILQTQIDDAGTYICELTNMLGTVRGPVNLSIKRDINTTSTTTGIVMMAVVCCVVITSLVWVVIIYQTRKRAQTTSLGPPGGYAEEGVGRYPSHLPPHHHHLPSDLVHTFTPLLANHPPDTYTTVAQDSGSEHSSGKDSGTGDSAQRSSEDLLPIDLTRSGLRRSLIICADSSSASALRGMSAVNVGPNGEILGCEDPVGRPRLSTFTSQHMAPGGYNPSLFTATLRCGSKSRLLPVPSPVTPSATLPRSRPQIYRDGSHRKSTLNSVENSDDYYPQKVQLPHGNDDNSDHCERYDAEHCQNEYFGINRRDSERHNARNSVCSAGDSRSELDLRTENSEVTPKNIIPAKNTLEFR